MIRLAWARRLAPVSRSTCHSGQVGGLSSSTTRDCGSHLRWLSV